MYRYTIKSNEWLTPSTILLTLQRKAEGHKAFGYIPGQYAAIAFSTDGRPSYARCFSITSSPTNIDLLQFSIRVQGRFTSRLSQIEPGSDIAIRGPYGGFVLDATKHADVIFVAGGIGIAPFMSMLRYMSATNYPYMVDLLYGVHDQTDIAFVGELRTLERTMPNLRIIYAVSKGGVETLAGQRAKQGRLDDAIFQAVVGGRAAEKTFFICGPPAFMNGMVDIASANGVPRDSIITEAFKQGNYKQTGKVTSWPRNMYVLGSLGIAVGAFAIMVSDIIKNLPATPLTSGSQAQSQLRSNRENNLDALIRALLPNFGEGRDDSPAATQALSDANTSSSSTTASSGSTQTPSPTSTSSSAATSTPAPVVSALVVTTPQPVCTTSASGVTTCR